MQTLPDIEIDLAALVNISREIGDARARMADALMEMYHIDLPTACGLADALIDGFDGRVLGMEN